MLHFLTSVLGKIVGAVIPTSIKYAVKRWFRPSIEFRKAPKNFFDHIVPSASREHVKEILGPPHRESSGRWSYRFLDAIIQIEFWDEGSAKSVAMALTLYSPKSGFKIPMMGLSLGQMYLIDAMEDDGKLHYRPSRQSEDLAWVSRIGPPGALHYYTFGAMWPIAGGYLAGTSFKWDAVHGRLITNPKDIRINWVAISDSMEDVWFDWSLGIPAILL